MKKNINRNSPFNNVKNNTTSSATHINPNNESKNYYYILRETIKKYKNVKKVKEG